MLRKGALDEEGAMKWMRSSTCVLAPARGACGGGRRGAVGGPGGPGGSFGATQGGVKDMKLARELVAKGQVPPASAFLVEGMFSEHDLPLDGPPCAALFCPRGAIGVADTLDGAASGWLQVGLAS